MFRVLFILICASLSLAGEIRYDLMRFVEEGLAKDPQVKELQHGTEAKKNQIARLKAEAILPTFNVTMMVGPAPGLKEELQDGDTVDVYDFSKMGPYWGVQAKFIQPLNLGQYRAGKMALEADVQQKSFDIENQVHKKDVELQTYYYNYLLAKEMIRIADDAKSKVDEAYEKLEEALDDDDPNVSQMDLLNLKAKMHTVKEGVAEANLGMRRVVLAIRFSLNLDEDDSFVASDSVLLPRKEPLPMLDEVRELTLKYHPELRQLSAGLRARRLQMDLAEAKLAPEFFIMGEVEYVKSWAGNRSVLQKNAFAEDAVNKLDGVIGIGVRYNLNFWKNWEGFRASRIDYRALQLKESYASDGLMARAEEQYYQVVAAKEKLDALTESLRASESILKGAAMQYDLDKSKTGELVSAYTQNVTMLKDYYFAVCAYNVEFAQLIAKMGMSLKDFHTIYMNQ
ncbi:TolC family protein [uncultured Fibrobacter sp.]|uniref:TolC family protein n=1 Tax=uncultured Fibrobacter sp. TaxID=261512 RepID=UPI00262507BD|nr:TolC family protein [uncultured Fibrobacter sp.]